MKLIVQIPCLNEEKTLPITLADIPRQIDGVDEVEVLIIDDGSTDRTVEVAREHGADHVVSLGHCHGLARAFAFGLDHAVRLGADIIVNTDGDNQYNGADIPRLIEPILKHEAAIVIGDRKTATIAHFSPLKKLLQRLGSWTVRIISGTPVPDATSGFRAVSRNAALRLNIISDFTYTLEMIIQAGKKGMPLTSVEVGTNAKLRESRLFHSIPYYIKRSLSTMIRIYALYEPLKVFGYIGALIFLPGISLVGRFLYYYLIGQGGGHIQSVVIGTTLCMLGFQIVLIGLLADLISSNRRLIEEVIYHQRLIALEKKETATEKK
jgi:glycosyltransferase involved in cell wall biosynthesis